MKSLNHDRRHLSRHDSDDKKMADDEDADAFMLLYFLTAKTPLLFPLPSVHRQWGSGVLPQKKKLKPRWRQVKFEAFLGKI